MNDKKSNIISDGISKIKYSLVGTKVFALVGRSGTGKSFRAKLVAEDFNIECMIDDGLLISKNQIIAGHSAKQETNYIGAIKTALFENLNHRKEVSEAIKQIRPKRILLIGTSKKMVSKITLRLDLPEVYKFILIEEIASEEEIKRAINYRKEGRHVIPVPSIEVERDYSRIFLDSVKILLKKSFGKKKHSKVYEKSVVRPSFDRSSQGRITISEAALSQMVMHCIDEHTANLEIAKIKVKDHHNNYSLKIDVNSGYNEYLGDRLHDLKNYIKDRIQRYTGIFLDEVNINISGITKKKKEVIRKKNDE